MRTLAEYNKEKFQALKTEIRESRLKRVTRMILEEAPGRLLDIGCGDGSFSSRFLSAGYSVDGVDLTENQVLLARSRGVAAIRHELGAGPIPYVNESFDIVFAGEVIEHLVDTSSFIGEILRILKPGGCAILTTPNLASFENRLRLLFGIYPMWLEYKLEGGQGHVRAYTPRVLKQQLREHGFTIEQHIGNWVPFIPQRFADDVRYEFLAFTGWLLPSLSMDILLKARKA
jgi:2-polyprenyl-3-methyl-5-hydroxy-6-metoxy-1,4-benzoquinol methylase